MDKHGEHGCPKCIAARITLVVVGRELRTEELDCEGPTASYDGWAQAGK